jgi:hypothetical protein
MNASDAEARARKLRGPARITPDRFGDHKFVIATFGWSNVARYIVLRKGDNVHTRDEAFRACFAGTIDKCSLSFEKVTNACAAFESTDFYMNEQAYDTSVEMLETRRKTDMNFIEFKRKLETFTGEPG